MRLRTRQVEGDHLGPQQISTVVDHQSMPGHVLLSSLVIFAELVGPTELCGFEEAKEPSKLEP